MADIAAIMTAIKGAAEVVKAIDKWDQKQAQRHAIPKMILEKLTRIVDGPVDGAKNLLASSNLQKLTRDIETKLETMTDEESAMEFFERLNDTLEKAIGTGKISNLAANCGITHGVSPTAPALRKRKAAAVEIDNAGPSPSGRATKQLKGEATAVTVQPQIDGQHNSSLHRPPPHFSRESCIRYLQTLIAKQSDFMPNPTFLSTVQGNGFMTAHLRTQYVDWFYDENEKMGFDCETPAIALNFLERYLSLKKVTKQELLIAMYASFSLAIRVHESVLVALSSTNKNEPTHDDVKLMEVDILQAISWRVHPVTSYCIARNVLALLPLCKESLSHQRQEDVDMLLYAAIEKYYLLRETPCTLAFAAVLAASAYSHLSTQSVWDLASDVGDCLNRDRIRSCCQEMLNLLTMYDEPVTDCPPERNTESPTGVQDLYLMNEPASVPQPMVSQLRPSDVPRSTVASSNFSKQKTVSGATSCSPSPVSAKKPWLGHGYRSPFQSPSLTSRIDYE